MDVPARQTYISLVVDASERSSANGIISLARSVGVSLSPLLVGYLISEPNNYYLFSSPFLISASLKILYDIALYLSFKSSGSKMRSQMMFQGGSQRSRNIESINHDSEERRSMI